MGPAGTYRRTSMHDRNVARPNRSNRRLLAAVLALAAAASGTLAPPSASAWAAAPPLDTPHSGNQVVTDAASTAADPAATPSIQYEQAMEHAGDVIDFAPGDRVSVPFSPRAGDHWDVDGKAPRAL